MISVENISITLGRKKILQSVSTNIKDGELVAIIGPNGAGKSTFLKIISGSLQPDEGHVEFLGKKLSDWKPKSLAQKRAVLSQQNIVSADFTVWETVLMGRYPHVKAFPGKKDFKIALSALREVGAEHLRKRYINTLSGGEQQRVHLARVFAQAWKEKQDISTKLLLLDEPVSSLDLQHQYGLLETVKEKCSSGFATVVVLHDLNLAARFADRILIFKDGCIAVDAPTEDAFDETILSNIYNIPVKVQEKDGQLIIIPESGKHIPTEHLKATIG